MAASNSAAASTSTAADSNNSTCYDVFISHRGPDVKRTFASHLYHRLRDKGLRVFLDYQELREGKRFPCQIEDAIRAASLHVAIFSPTYADSPWCLEEVVLMLKSSAPIIPVFHRVKPTELDGEGVYATSLQNLEKKRDSDSQPRYDSKTIENWRNALSRVARVADISGLDLEAFNGDEGKLIDKIVEVVFRKGVERPLNVATYPTGLAEKVQDFETKVLLQQCSGRVQILGITGLGGVGKTTLAIELFNWKSSKYSKSKSSEDSKPYFLFDVRKDAKESLHSLQSQLLKGLLQLELHIDNWRDGIEKLKKHLSSRKVLLVLDDVDHQDQVFALLPPLNDLHHDSLILITSRDKDVLRRSGVQESSIYQLSGLNKERSRELFCYYAFCNPYPLPEFEYLVDNFLKVCKGLPLSLKVFGERLRGKTDKSYWESELEALRKTLPSDIQKSFQISYDALDREEKQMFLDIACFFIGIDRDTAISVWDGSGWNGKRAFQSLMNRCLVEVYMEDNYEQGVKMQHRIRMRDDLRDMGRDLANTSGFPCRLWCGTKHMEDSLQQSSSEATRVRGIRMFPREHYDERSDTDEDDERASFSRYKMKNLQILDILEGDDDLLKCLLEGVDSPNLLYLRWRNCRCSSLPPYIPMKKLRVLDVEGCQLETLWQEDLQAPLELRELRIRSDGRFIIPKSIGQLKQLERMVVDAYSPFGIPQEFCYLRSLKHLVLHRVNLSSLTESFGNLSMLEYIDLSDCDALERLPDSFGNLSRLEHISLSKCSDLRLPDFLFDKCLLRLQHLELHKIQISQVSFPTDVCPNLQHLHIRDCEDLIEVRTLPNALIKLQLHRCPKLKLIRIEKLAQVMQLREMRVRFCDGLEEMVGVGYLKPLEVMQVSNCMKLKIIQGLEQLTQLRELDFSYCSELEELLGVGHLKSLEVFKATMCQRLKRIRGLEQLTLLRLRELDISYCSELETLS